MFRNRSIQTDCIFWSIDGEIEPKERYTVIRTPSRPDYFWGNLLIYNEAPTKRDAALWSEDFRVEFANRPDIRHQAFTWDDPMGEMGAADSFKGFEPDCQDVLISRSVVQPVHHRHDLSIRPIRSDADWEAVYKAKLAIRPPEYAEAMYDPFMKEQVKFFRRLVSAGHGLWHGAYLDGQLAANLGLFVTERIGRFQSVDTSPEFRKQGICRSLVYAVSSAALEKSCDELVMVASSNEKFNATGVYRSVGFKVEQKVGTLEYTAQ